MDLLLNLGLGIVGGLVATALWTILVWKWWQNRNQKSLGRLVGTFKQTEKFDETREHPTLVITQNYNVLNVQSANEDFGEISGEIIMNELHPRLGAGSYTHVKEGVVLYGLWQIIVQSESEILVHAVYSNKEHRMIFKGYIWRNVAR